MTFKIGVSGRGLNLVAFPFKAGVMSCSLAISTDIEVWVEVLASGASGTISSGEIMTSFLLLNVLVDDDNDGRRDCPRPIGVPLPMAMPLLVTDEGGGMEVEDADGSGIVGSGGGKVGRSGGAARLVEGEDTTDMVGGAMDLRGAMDKGE
jgi:hypothetical protein